MTSTPSSHRPVEVELKYRVVDSTAADRYLVAEEIAGFKPSSAVRSTQVEDRYIDTADGALARAGFAARIRQTAKGTTVGIKSAVRRIEGGNVHRREELEGPADRTAHPRDWPPSDARSLILEQCGDAPLVEVVTIRQLRRKRLLKADGTTVELSLDEVDAVARSRVVGRFVELEVELVMGRESGLMAIDKTLAADPGLVVADSSKLERALRAVISTEPRRGKKSARVLPPVDVDDIDGEREERIDDGLDVGRIVAAALGEAAATVETVAPEEAPEAAPHDERPERAQKPTVREAASSASTHEAAAETAARPKTARPAREPASHERPKLIVGKTPGVLPDDHLAEAGRKVLRFHLARMIAKEAGTREGKDAEDLHAMRVATRRQRAAWRIFGEAFRKARTKPHRGRLR